MWKVKDIAGFDVFEPGDVKLGRLVDVLPSGSNDVWVIKNDLNNREYLLPALASVVLEVDTGKKRITVLLPAGLKEIYERE